MKHTYVLTEMHFSGVSLMMRLLLASVFGIIIAGLLTLFMRMLIEFSQRELVETVQVSMLDFVRVKREESSERTKNKPERPKTQEVPPAPIAPQNSAQDIADVSINIAIPAATADIQIEMGGISVGDGEYLPIVKVAPAYPIKASSEGTEGTCLVEFTVTASGATKDVIVVPEKCPPVFVRTSKAAARKFKYKPRVVDGEAIEVPHVRNLFRYKLKDPGEQ